MEYLSSLLNLLKQVTWEKVPWAIGYAIICAVAIVLIAGLFWGIDQLWAIFLR